MFRLTKTKIKEGKSSSVGSGSEATGDVLYRKQGDVDMEEIDISKVEVGDMLMVFTTMFNFIKTSPITKIINSDREVSVEFETETSEYKLGVS